MVWSVKEAMVEGLFGGRTKASGQGATPNTFGYDPNIRPYGVVTLTTV